MSRRSSRGLALLIVVSVLGVMGLLGTAFLSMAQLERKASQRRVHATRALLLARSGLEDALARLGASQDANLAPSRYGGEDFNDDGILSPGLETAAQMYQPAACNREDCPVRMALRPSFSIKDPAGMPALLDVDGRPRGYSGTLKGEAAPTRHTYALKVLPQNGFYLNGGNPGEAPTVGYNAVLKRMLGTLAEAMDREDGANNALPLDQTDGERLVSARPASGWQSWSQVRDLALGGSQDKLEALKPYLALDAWVDRKVIVPHADPARIGASPQTWVEIKRWHLGSPEPDLGARAPVDLAWARRHRPALIALLDGLQGLYLDESTAEPSTIHAVDTSHIGTLRAAEIRLDWAAGTDECRTLADRILAFTSDLRTWDQWNAFCDAVPSALLSGTSDLRQAKRDLLKANFNPNSDLNKFNPDPAMARLVDKSDLLVYSTEFCLLPCAGQNLDCVGRVLDAQGRLLASRVLSSRLGPPRVVRLTTQADFVAGNLGDPGLPGDESAFRGYGDAGYIPQSSSMDRTFGSRLALTGYLTGDSRGVSLQTGPEPHTARPALYDGQLRLATLEDLTAPSMLFLAHWTRNFDSDDVGGITPNTPVSWASPPNTTITPNAPASWEAGLTPSSPLLGRDPAVPPGMLEPDGLYLEKGDLLNGGERARQPGYPCQGNMAPHHGTLSFWVKANHTDAPPRHHTYVNATLERNPAPGGNPFIAVKAVFLVGHVLGNGVQVPEGRGFGAMYRTSDDYFDQMNWLERKVWVVPDPASPSHRWRLLTYFWDMEDLGTTCQVMHADRGTSTNLSGASNVEDDLTQPVPLIFDFTALGNCFYPGRGRQYAYFTAPHWSWPDATLDEFAIWDFGAPAPARLATQALARTRFEAGRFYKESAYAGLGAAGNTAGEWFSAPLGLGRGVRLQNLAWTQIVPRGLKGPAPAAGAFPEDGDAGNDGRILLELTNAAGTAYLLDDAGRPVLTASAGIQDPSSLCLDRSVSAPFRLHAVFQPNLADPLGKAILDPLVLDDITLVYRDASGPRVTAWGGEE